MRRSAPLIAFALFVTLASCVKNPFPTEPSDPATETFNSALGVNIATMQKTDLGVYYRDSVVGGGTEVSASTASAVYEWIGYLKNGNVWGVSLAGGDTVPFAGGALPVGIQDGIIGMRVGGKRLIVVPSALGYGSTGAGAVPPNATLVMSIHLVDAQP